jgi:hypothetical protein
VSTAGTPAGTVTVLTAQGEKRFRASECAEDDDGNLSILDGTRKVARFREGQWSGYYLEDALDGSVATAPGGAGAP